jgi:hypothetical protein
MLALATAMLVPEVFELLDRNSSWGLFVPRQRESIANVAPQIHEVANSFGRFRIKVVSVPPNPSMEVRSPKLGIEQPMGKVCPIVAPPLIDTRECAVLEVLRKEVTIDEGPVEVLRSPNHVASSGRLWGSLFFGQTMVIHNGFLPLGHIL